MYRSIPRWAADDRTAFYHILTVDRIFISKPKGQYGIYFHRDPGFEVISSGGFEPNVGFICQKYSTRNVPDPVFDMLANVTSLYEKHLAKSNSWKRRMVECPDQHYALDYLSCNPESNCGIERHQKMCSTEILSIPEFSEFKPGSALMSGKFKTSNIG